MGSYSFLKQDVPPTANPSLWRIAQLNMTNGLFKVTERIYQVRGFDLSNMTIVEGDQGLIIIGPLISTEVAKAALDLYYQHRPKKPVVADIATDLLERRLAHRKQGAAPLPVTTCRLGVAAE